jgi:methylthioribose-1-phosphate isomerase
VQRLLYKLLPLPQDERHAAAWDEADALAEEDVAVNHAIGHHGLSLITAIAERRPGPVQVLTHCNAGWLATVDWGTATSPIYQAHAAGVPLHVWVDLVIVGCDRVTARGDVCNKIGTYLKALAAFDNRVPFYVAMPTSTLDLTLADGMAEIPIEERSPREVTHLAGRLADGRVAEVQITPDGSAAANPAFDVTPARLVSGLITEHGIVAADEAALRSLMLGRR